MIIEGIDTLPGALFLEELRDIVASSDEKEEFIFIHGFNSSFTDAAKRTAQLAHDIGFKGVPIFYSWPSRGKATPFAYTADEDAVQWTVPHFKSFLYNVIKQTGAKKVHLVCHSMGIRALGNVMQSIQQDFKDVVFDQIIIAAPDISVDIFKRDIAQHFRGVAKRMTIYVSANDRALRLSRNIHHDIRLGEIDNIIRGFETVDATNLKSSDFFDHAYFDQSRPVLTDISLLFQRNIPPTDTARNLTEMGIVNGNYWIFKR
jgi:esterase/lipase superfamily enzyme